MTLKSQLPQRGVCQLVGNILEGSDHLSSSLWTVSQLAVLPGSRGQVYPKGFIAVKNISHELYLTDSTCTILLTVGTMLHESLELTDLM